MDYLTVKFIHIVSSTILFGTGLGTAFVMFFANHFTRKTVGIKAVVFATRLVVLADWIFTTPAVILQPVTGLWLAHQAHYDLGSGWVLWALGLFGFAGACWLPVVWIQYRMRDLAREAEAAGEDLPRHYWRYERLWTTLGFMAFPAVVAIFWLMVVKP